MSDPWLDAWHKLRALPDVTDPVAYAQHAEAAVQVVREILGDAP